MILCGSSVQTTGQRANTRMNESKYSVKGISQISGTGDRSVVMCVVMPSIMLDGTAARAIHLRRRNMVTSSSCPNRTDGAGLAMEGRGAATGALAVIAVSGEGASGGATAWVS